MDPLAALGFLGAGLALAASLDVLLGTRRIASLADERVSPGPLPPLSVVIAARNEAEHVERALRSVLAQDYPSLEVIVVDDRSEDRTGAILDALAAQHASLTVVHVDLLPDGWLGKTHALHTGAARATGAYMLFTDADVVFGGDALRRALQRAERDHLDHLAIAPAITSPSRAVRAFVAGFAFFFSLLTRPWRLDDPRSRSFIGIGAFNLVRTRSYRAVGGHAPIRLRPDDDLMLGKLLRLGGARARLLFGAGVIAVDWYPSLGALVQGLMKNAFAGVGYRVSATAGSVLGLLLVGVIPFAAFAAGHGALRWAGAAASCAVLVAAMDSTRAAGQPRWYGLALPASTLLFSWILVRATALTLWRGGVHWRGTFYPLDQLKRNRL